jgi:protein phosphatase 1G
MGAYLSQPVTEKETVSGEGRTVQYAVSSMQGWRRTMEDGKPVCHALAHAV